MKIKKKTKKPALPVYKNPRMSVERRVDDLLGQMTPEEKIDMISGINSMYSKPNKRLGIPSMNMADGPMGVRWGSATAFPAGIAWAASWDTEVARSVSRAIAREARAKGRNVMLGPCVNIHRVPHGGRNFESFGEDPHLASRMTVSYIRAMQKEKVIATVKHFACNNQEHERLTIDEYVDERTLHEIYFPAFRAAALEAGCWSYMAAYNKLNGHFCSENNYLLDEILKKRWNFKGFVMSDWGAVNSTIETANSGLDIEMPDDKYLKKDLLLEAIKNGTVNESRIDDKIRRMLRAMFSMGFFEKQKRPGASIIRSKEHKKVALESAQAGMVLLKNEKGLLPLDLNNIKSIAVIGPNALVARTGGGGSSKVSPVYAVSPVEGIRNITGKRVKINFAVGTFVHGDDAPAIAPEYLIPPSCGNRRGLLAQYYNNMDLSGTPVLTRVDKQINFNWFRTAPARGVNQEGFSVRWTGKLLPPRTASFILSATSDDGIRVWIDGNLVIDMWRVQSAVTESVEIGLDKAKQYDLKVEYFQNKEDARAKLCLYEKDILSEAVQEAKKSDVAIIFAGLSDHFETEGKDRDDLYLAGSQDELIREVSRVNKNTIVVLNTGAPVLTGKWIDKVPALIEAWYPGQEGGNAIANILFGKVNPSGKLPMTFLKEWEDSPAFGNYPGKDGKVNYAEGIFVGYRHFDAKNIQPLFPFGYGLSYTTFAYSDLNIKLKKQKNDVKVGVSFCMKNTGKRPGAEAVQLYVNDVQSSVKRPVKELKGFKKINLKPGEKKRLIFELDKSAFAFYDAAINDWRVEPGTFKIMIGSSSRDIRLEKELVI